MECRVCDSKKLEPVIDLGLQPWGNNFLKPEEVGKETFYPLRVVFCHDCFTAQLDYTVRKEIMFSNHTYLSGVTKTLDEHFKKIALEVDSRFFSNKKNKSALDLGSNDGTQLKHYKDIGYEVLGVESSSNIAKIANERGINTISRFFNLDTAIDINKKFDVINASGFFFHLEELHSVTDGIKYLLADDGVFVVQFIYMKSIIDNLAFDQIYHEHLLYYTLNTIEKLLQRHDLSMFDAYFSPIHGGSIMGFVTHKGKKSRSKRLENLIKEEDKRGINNIETYKKFSRDIDLLKDTNLHYLKKEKSKGKVIYGMGAPVKGNTLLNYFRIGPDIITYLVEKNPMRKGLYSPGMHIPIIMEDEIDTHPDIYYVLAWNFKKEILEKNKNLIEKGVEFYFPIDPY